MKKMVAIVAVSLVLCVMASGAFAQSWYMQDKSGDTYGTATRTESAGLYTWTFALDPTCTDTYNFGITLHDYCGGNVTVGSLPDKWGVDQSLSYGSIPGFKMVDWYTPDGFYWPNKLDGPTFSFSSAWDGTCLNWSAKGGTNICNSWCVCCGDLTPVPEPTSVLAACSILAPIGLVFRRRRNS